MFCIRFFIQPNDKVYLSYLLIVDEVFGMFNVRVNLISLHYTGDPNEHLSCACRAIHLCISKNHWIYSNILRKAKISKLVLRKYLYSLYMHFTLIALNKIQCIPTSNGIEC